MFKNYVKIALRNLLHHKAYSILNISGLAIGMASSILILLWVNDELSFDRFHTNANQLYRLTCNAGDFKAAVTPAGMAEGLQTAMPQVKATVRLSKPVTCLMEVGNRKFEEKSGFFADSNFLQVFTFSLAKGDPATAMQRPDGILITREMAKKYFGKEEAMGKVIRRNNSENCTVTGILDQVPSASHLQFDFILPISSIQAKEHDLKNKVWGNFNYYTYIQLDKKIKQSPATLAKLEATIKSKYKEHSPNMQIDFQLQPLTAIHLHSNLQIDVAGHGNIQYVNIFFIVALFIIAVACINFMNLATARSARRAKEVGLRKVVGAGRYQLILQFLGESLFISFISLLIAVVTVLLLLPAFNLIAEKKLVFHVFDPTVLLILLGIALITGLLSGSYPALFLSSLRPVKVIKGRIISGRGNLLLRNGLVVTQFVVSILLLVGTAVVYRQLNFIQNKSLGFEKSNLLYIPMTGEIWEKQPALKSALKQNPLTSNFTIISDLPTNLTSGTIDVKWEGKDPKSQIVIPSMDVDESFIDVFKMKMLTGRSFSTAFKTDTFGYVINEKAMQVMGMSIKNAVGKSIEFSDAKGPVIGVVKDFNFKSLQYEIEPLIIRLNKWGGLVMVRTQPGNTAATIQALEKISLALNPAYPFSYSFLDKDLDNLYRSTQQMGNIFNLFAILAIFISCLGLYGLSAFMAEQRTREIGVRKVLGASVFNIVYLLSGKFTRLIIVAICIAIPLSWLAINSWLESFAYHIDVSWIIFLAVSISALGIAWLTVGYESVKAAIANPVQSLRNE